MKKISAFLLLICLLLLAFGCSENKKTTPVADEGKVFEEKKAKIAEIVETKEEKDAVDEILSEMTLEEKVWQLMFVKPESITKVGTVEAAGDKTKEALMKYPVGGIIYFKDNLKNRDQVIEMISNTQSYSKIPLFISVDEEGGNVSRIGSQPQLGTKKQPPMGEIGATGDPANAYAASKQIASDIKALGFNVDFAPVADVLINENNAEIGSRSFGSDPEMVAPMVENAVKGFQDNGVSATLKHFPGQGSTVGFTDRDETELNRTLEELRSAELKPFKAGIDAGADFVMMSGSYPMLITGEDIPCVLSPKIVQDILIKELGFEGVIISDTLQEGAVPKYKERVDSENEKNGKPAVKMYVMVLQAGNDMLLLPENLDEAHKEIMDAVKSGELTEERINESVRKILKLKIKKGLWK